MDGSMYGRGHNSVDHLGLESGGVHETKAKIHQIAYHRDTHTPGLLEAILSAFAEISRFDSDLPDSNEVSSDSSDEGDSDHGTDILKDIITPQN